MICFVSFLLSGLILFLVVGKIVEDDPCHNITGEDNESGSYMSMSLSKRESAHRGVHRDRTCNEMIRYQRFIWDYNMKQKVGLTVSTRGPT